MVESGYLWVRDPSSLDRTSRETAALREEVIRARDVAETLTDGPGRGIVTGSCGGFGSYSGVVSNGIVDILLEA